MSEISRYMRSAQIKSLSNNDQPSVFPLQAASVIHHWTSPLYPGGGLPINTIPRYEFLANKATFNPKTMTVTTLIRLQSPC